MSSASRGWLGVLFHEFVDHSHFLFFEAGNKPRGFALAFCENSIEVMFGNIAWLRCILSHGIWTAMRSGCGLEKCQKNSYIYTQAQVSMGPPCPPHTLKPPAFDRSDG